MTMTPGVRKFALTTHLSSSIGWLGAVAAFLALAVAGVTSKDAQMVRAAYLAMHLTVWFVIVPLSLAAFLTGIVESLGYPVGIVPALLDCDEAAAHGAGDNSLAGAHATN